MRGNTKFMAYLRHEEGSNSGSLYQMGAPWQPHSLTQWAAEYESRLPGQMQESSGTQGSSNLAAVARSLQVTPTVQPPCGVQISRNHRQTCGWQLADLRHFSTAW